RTALRIWRIVKGHPEDIMTEELNSAVSSYRLGAHADAEEGFTRLRYHPLCRARAMQAELNGALAMVAALAEDDERVIERVEVAITRAEKCDEADVLVRVLRSASEAARRCAPERARDFAERARAIVDRNESIGPEDALAVMVTSLDLGETDPAIFERALVFAS